MDASIPDQSKPTTAALALLRFAALSEAQIKVSTEVSGDGSKSKKRVKKRKLCKVTECDKRDAGGGHCKRHGGGSRCKVTTCNKSNAGGGKCVKHGGGKKCKLESCSKAAATAGGTGLCVAHGGGNRCKVSSCNKLVQRKKQKCKSSECPDAVAQKAKVDSGTGKGSSVSVCQLHATSAHAGHDHSITVSSTKTSVGKQTSGSQRYCKSPGCFKRDVGGGLCTSHGGGKRCKQKDCNTKAAGAIGLCTSHGGGRRCKKPGCDKLDCGGGFCVRHGGGRRCRVQVCDKGARGSSGLCISHSGGKKCKMPKCSTSARGPKGLCISHGGGFKSEILARMKRASMRAIK